MTAVNCLSLINSAEEVKLQSTVCHAINLAPQIMPFN